MASNDWDCVICSQTDCIHLNPDFQPSVNSLSKYDMMREPITHQEIQISELVLIVSSDKSAFRVQKNKLPTGSILDVNIKNWSENGSDSIAKIKIPFSKGVLKLIWHFFFTTCGKEVIYKEVGKWIDVLSKNNVDKILPVIETDWKNICFEQFFQAQFVDSILPNIFENVDQDPRAVSNQPILPKINGKYYPTRMFVRILADYLIFPLRLENYKIVTYKEDYKITQKMYQAYSRNQY
ncbi:hypothetical protein QJ854_gp716 [Moumouvirus goulette]|uniref:Uncharacterized protein n=1 Tax=Moumouvirus goulette TaxID=1247379 RepID=M1PMA2_9VIRU|nr:hypothetical protein QJ854_gp716 [Moumouvirus goulette]AGF85066.1 hypothetical protein glt_00257 [Moumouvirus goulette]